MKDKWLGSWRDQDGLIHHDLLLTATTNNQAEYGSMLLILRHIRQWADHALSNGYDIWLREAIIYGDSQLVIYQMNGKYRVKEVELKPLWLEAVNLVHILKEEFGIVVTFKWVKREINNEVLGLNGKLKTPGPE